MAILFALTIRALVSFLLYRVHKKEVVLSRGRLISIQIYAFEIPYLAFQQVLMSLTIQGAFLFIQLKQFLGYTPSFKSVPSVCHKKDAKEKLLKTAERNQQIYDKNVNFLRRLNYIIFGATVFAETVALTLTILAK